MRFWAVVFLVATSLVAVLKHEREETSGGGDLEGGGDPDLGIVDTYRSVLLSYIH